MKYLMRAVCGFLIFFSSTSFATPYPDIDSDTYFFGSDIDGDGYFSQTNRVTIAVESFDAFNNDSLLEFGIYFEGASSELITLFGTSEPQESAALIDFKNGVVLDIDDFEIESIFTPTTADYGFYLSLDAGSTVVFSDPLLNGGYDLFGAFPLLGPDVPSGIFAAMFFNGSPEDLGIPLYLAPIVGISEPYTFALLGLGLMLMGSFKRRR